MKRPNESDYTSQVAYARALEEYCDTLAQPAQEPVAWMTQARNFVNLMEFTEAEAKLYGWTPVYIAPPAAVMGIPTTGDYAMGYAEGFNDACKRPAQEPNNFCPRCGKRLEGVLGQPQVHTCTPPLWGHK
jgi:hypothetical protein